MEEVQQEERSAPRAPLTAFVDRDQRRQLAALARREDRSVSAIVRLALADYLNSERKEPR